MSTNKINCEHLKEKLKLDNPVFISDVDGVFTDGSFYYNTTGILLKKFGPDDFDALRLLERVMPVVLVSGDSKGKAITEHRIVTEGNFEFYFVRPFDRVEWLKETFPKQSVIYMGDSFLDKFAFEVCSYTIAPNNACVWTKEIANYVTQAAGGDRAVSEAVFHVLETFISGFSIRDLTLDMFRHKERTP